jgi:glycosyltransferase involved in cell wall biosynthesis
MMVYSKKQKTWLLNWALLEKITFTGPINNTELPAYYSSHSVFLNTTSYESFGMAVLEAAACGIPTVSTPVGEIPLLWKAGEEIMLTDVLNLMIWPQRLKNYKQ